MPDKALVPDLRAFKEANWSLGDLSPASLVALAEIVRGEIGPHTRPEAVPFEILDAMGWDPFIYLGEQSIAGAVVDPEIYYIRHPDPGIVAETEAWLWETLPQLLRICVKATAYGAVPFVCDWGIEDDHVHYTRVFDLHPASVAVRRVDRRVVGLSYNGQEYGEDRAYIAVWDQVFGSLIGMGSRRRAYKAWYKATLVDLWQARYLERSVDIPRIGFAPSGPFVVGGNEISATEYLASALLALKNGGACVLPSDMVEGQKQWDVKLLELPDRSDVWDRALGRYDAIKLLATMVPPSAVGAESASLAGARVPAQLFLDHVQAVANFCAGEVTKLVKAVHGVNRPGKGPEVLAREIPSQRKKLLLEIFKAVANVPRALEDGSEVTLAELVSDTIIDGLGLEKRPVDEAAREPRAAAPGPQRGPDMTSERQDRRESATTDTGEAANGHEVPA